MKVLLFKTRASFSLFGHSERHQGLTVKTSGLKKSYKSPKTAAVLRPSLTNFFAVLSKLCKAKHGQNVKLPQKTQ